MGWNGVILCKQLSSSVVRRVVEWIVLESLEVKLMSGWLTHAMKWSMTLQNITQRNKTIIWIYALGIFLVKSDVLNISFAKSLFGWLHRKIPISKTSMEKTKRFWHLTLGFLLTTRCSPISRFWGGDPIRPHPHLHSRGYEIPEEAVQERSYPVHKGLGRNGWNGDIRLLERWIRLGVSMAEKCR